MLRTILIPTDLRPPSRKIIFEAQRLLAGQEGSTIELFHVLVPAARARSDPRGGEVGLVATPPRLEALRDELIASGQETRIRIERGDPAEQILKRIRDDDIDLTAMATGGGQSWLRGSVADRVLRKTRRPLLLLDPPAEPGDWHMRIDRILVPLDGSKVAGHILQLIEPIARAYSSELILFHAADEPLAIEDSPLKLALKLCENAGLNARGLIGQGRPVESILGALEQESIDLLAMTTHGHGGGVLWPFGAVALKVLHRCHRPVLIRRETED